MSVRGTLASSDPFSGWMHDTNMRLRLWHSKGLHSGPIISKQKWASVPGGRSNEVVHDLGWGGRYGISLDGRCVLVPRGL